MSKFSLKNISFSQITGIIFIVLLLTFIGQNLDFVNLHFIIWEFQMPIFLVTIIAFFIGFYTAVLTGGGIRQNFQKNEKSQKFVNTPPLESMTKIEK